MSESVNYVDLFYIVLAGDTQVGKTCILDKVCSNKFKEFYTSTIGINFGTKSRRIGNRKVKFLIWDTSGDFRYKSVTQYYCNLPPQQIYTCFSI